MRDRARPGDHQHVRAAGDSRQHVDTRALRDVLPRDWQLRRRDVRAGGTPFKVPAPGLVIVLACLVIGWMLTSVTLGEWAAFGIVVGVATVIFAFRRKSLATPAL